MDGAGAIGLLEPCNLGKHSAIGPGIDVMVGDGFDGNVIAENLAHGVVVETFGAGYGFPILVVGGKEDAVGSRAHL